MYKILMLACCINAMAMKNHGTVKEWYGDEFNIETFDNGSRISSGSIDGLEMVNLPENEYVGYGCYPKNIDKEFPILIKNSRFTLEGINVSVNAYQTCWTFKGCGGGFWKTPVQHKFSLKNSIPLLQENCTGVSFVFKECLSVPEVDFFKKLLEDWNGKTINVQIPQIPEGLEDYLRSLNKKSFINEKAV